MIAGNAKARKVTIRAKIIRADGRVEDLGVISRSGWFWSFMGRLKKWLPF